MNNIRTIIIDDESLARKGLRLRLADYKYIEIIDECSNGLDALESIQTNLPDLIFLDIEMPALSGIELLTRLQGDALPLIVFVTAYQQYAVNAFELHAIDYLLKPIDLDRLKETISRVKKIHQQNNEQNQKEKLIEFVAKLTGNPSSEIISMVENDDEAMAAYPDKIAIKDRDETSLVKTTDIAWIEAAGDYMCIHANDEVHILRSTMKELERKLNPAHFQRIHRSTIVNLHLIEKVSKHINGEYHLMLSNGSLLKMSRGYRDKIKHII